MSTKKIILIVVLFLLGIGVTITGAVLMVTENPGKKISAETFKEKIIKDGCNISDEQNSKTGNIKTQIISMEYGCPYNISYVEFHDTDYQKNYVASNINKINYNNGNITTRLNINIFDYQEVRTIGSAYNVLISRDDMVVMASSTKKNKEKLDQVIDSLGITTEIAWNKIWLLGIGIVLIWASMILLVIFLIQNNRKKKLQ